MENNNRENMKKKELKISACLVVYNEEKNIRRCLDSLCRAVDEIIVVHDGECQDKTLEICQEYGAKIFVRSHVGAQEAHMVFAIKQTQGDWLLRIDADEFLSNELKNNLRRLVEEAESKGISAYSFSWLIFFENKFLPGTDCKSILFNKSALYWFSMPHLGWRTRGRLKVFPYILGHMSKNYTAAYWVRQKEYAQIQAEYILKGFEELDNFQAEKADWFRTYSFSRRYARCWFLPILKFLKSFCFEYFSGVGLRESWRRGLYNFYFGRYLYKKSKTLKK